MAVIGTLPASFAGTPVPPGTTAITPAAGTLALFKEGLGILAGLGGVATAGIARAQLGSQSDLPERVIAEARILNAIAGLTPAAGLAIPIGFAIEGIAIGIDAVRAQEAQRRARQDRRQFNRTFARIGGGPAVLEPLGLTSRALRGGIGGPTDPRPGLFGFTLPPAQAAFVAARLTRPRKTRKQFPGPDPENVIRAFGIGPRADELRAIENQKVIAQRSVAFAGGAVPSLFARTSRA